MNDFINGLLSIAAIFAVCLAAAFVAMKIIRTNKPEAKRGRSRKRQAVYYVAAQADRPRPKPRTVSIKGTLLTEEQLDELLKK